MESRRIELYFPVTYKVIGHATESTVQSPQFRYGHRATAWSAAQVTIRKDNLTATLLITVVYLAEISVLV